MRAGKLPPFGKVCGKVEMSFGSSVDIGGLVWGVLCAKGGGDVGGVVSGLGGGAGLAGSGGAGVVAAEAGADIAGGTGDAVSPFSGGVKYVVEAAFRWAATYICTKERTTFSLPPIS